MKIFNLAKISIGIKNNDFLMTNFDVFRLGHLSEVDYFLEMSRVCFKKLSIKK